MSELIIKVPPQPIYVKPLVVKLKIGLDKLIKSGYVEFISFLYENNKVLAYAKVKDNDISATGEGKTYIEALDNLNQKFVDMNLEL